MDTSKAGKIVYGYKIKQDKIDEAIDKELEEEQSGKLSRLPDGTSKRD